jgi:hypothetical protein
MAFFKNAITQLSVLGVPMYAGISTASVLPSSLSLSISVNAPTIIGKANIPVDPSLLVLSINDPTIIATNGTFVYPNPLVIKISTNAPTIIGKANVPINELTLLINTNDPIIRLGKNIFPDTFVLNISTNAPTVVGKANISVDPSLLVLSINDPTIIGKANVPVNESVIIISINDPTIIAKANISVDPSLLVLSINDPTIEIRFPQTVIVTSLILYVSLIAPTFVTEISEYDQYPACPRDIFGDWFQEDKPIYDSEKELFAMLHMESFNMFGVPMYYYAASYNTSANKIFGEDNNRRFTQSFDIMSYYRLPREDKLWSKFGIEGIDEITMYISKEHFQYVTSSTGGYSYIPKTGDIIKAKYNNYYYEIVAIKEEASQFLQSKRYVWELIVRPFKDAHIINMISGDPIGTVTNKTTDLFDRVQAINAKMSGIAYQNKPCEKPANDPFASWR